MVPAAALVFAGKSVATPAISFLVNKAFTYLNEFYKADCVDEMKHRILLALPKIQVVFDVINPECIKESSALEAWLWQLRDAVEKAEDAIDEVEYYELEEKAKDRKVSDWGSALAKMKHRAIKSVVQSSIVDKAIKGLTDHGTLKSLQSAVEGLDKASAGVANFLSLTDHLKANIGEQEEGFFHSNRETGSMLTATKVFGRDKEKELVIGWLTQTSDEDAEIMVSSNHVSVISIVGHGGMGKTTLAQLIRQDDAVTKHFEIVIFACVSTSFDAKTIIHKALESATLITPDVNTLEALQRILEKKLNSKRFLLVLDDVWDDKNIDQWEKLSAPLRAGKKGSKILLTTRMQSVADLASNAMGGRHECLALQGLRQDENVELFNCHAFPHGCFQDYTVLQPIGEQIAKNVRGCPLVTKVVASHLKGKKFRYWNNFLHQRLEHFEGSADDIMNVLKLSYYDLPIEMQNCFRYCSIFPQDYAFNRDELVEMWVSSGLISQVAVGSESLVDIGEQYLDQLIRKSFFDPSPRFGIGKYVMHDLMHDLAKYVSSGECARIVDVASLENVASTVRHICVEDIHNFPVEKIKKMTHLENLRTIIIKNEQAIDKDMLNTVEELVEHSKSLRLFQSKLRHTSDFLGKLGKLKHLRSLKLEQISAESICGIVKLYHLTTLNCNHVKIELKQLKDIGNLDRLQNVTYGSDGWGMFPVGRLVSLLALDGYYIQGLKGYTISALKDLGSLRRLGVEGLENIGNQEEAKEAKLKAKHCLESLSLQWSEQNDSQSMIDELILDNLEPHANLMKLYISGFRGTRMPHWIAKPSLKNLERLKIKKCRYCEQLPILEILTLKHLQLEDLPRLGKIGQALNVSGDLCVELFPPSLETLRVEHCPTLRELPLLPPSLVSLYIKGVGLTKLPRIGKLHNGNTETISSQLHTICVKDCQNLTSLEGSLFEQRQYMGALCWLRVIRCEQLESAPLPFEEMNGLQGVSIAGCPKVRMLRDVEDKLLPSSIRYLKMGKGGDLELPLLRSLQGLSNLSSMELYYCSVVESLPSADVFKSLKSLEIVKVIGCRNLSSLGGIGSLRYLWRLKIEDCYKLPEAGLALPQDVSGGEENMVAPRCSLQIDMLIIYPPSVLLVEPLNSLCHTKSLAIWNGSEMESLPEAWLLQNRSSLQDITIRRASSLESLPPGMRDLSSLESFSLDGAEQLQSLPHLPSSLKWLSIRECSSELAKKLSEYGSPERDRISHVREVTIGDSFFIMGKKCSYETCSKLRKIQTLTHFLPG
ncbi:hypothetical protein ACP70R_019922 [Stipagrostis hirtigluma subsp. patula]